MELATVFTNSHIAAPEIVQVVLLNSLVILIDRVAKEANNDHQMDLFMSMKSIQNSILQTQG